MSATSNVVPIKSQPRSSRWTTGQRLLHYQWMVREHAHLGASEFRLAIVVLDATVGWGRETYYCSQKELAARCGMGRRTMQRVQASLERAGVLVVQPTGHLHRYSLALEDDMRFKKERQNGASDAPKRRRPLVDSTRYETKTGNQQTENQGARPPTRAPELAAEVVPRVKRESEKRYAVQLEKHMERKDPRALWTTWLKAGAKMPGELRTVRSWGPKERGQAKHLARWWDNSARSLHLFIDWSVSNWAQIIRRQFEWMADAPVHPHIGFLLAWKHKFLDDMTMAEMRQARPGDGDRVARLVEMGYEYHVAVALDQVEEQRTKDRKSMEEEQARAAAMLEKAQRIQAENMRTTSPQARERRPQQTGRLPDMTRMRNYYEEEK